MIIDMHAHIGDLRTVDTPDHVPITIDNLIERLDEEGIDKAVVLPWHMSPEGITFPGMFGPMPSFGLFLRHATGIEVTDTKIDCAKPDARPAFVLDDVRDAAFARVIVPHPKDASAFDLRGVSNFSVKDSRGLPDTQLATRVERQKL